MNTKVKLALSLACVYMLGSVAQAEVTPTVGFSMDYYGKYVWRGQNLVNDPVLQPGATIGLGNFTLGIWGSMQTTDIQGEKNTFTEVDYSLDYSADVPGVEGLGYSIGTICYDFPKTTGAASETYEVYFGLSLDTLLSPSFTYFYDYDDAMSSYLTFGIGHSIPDILGEGSGVSADLSASLGWGGKKYNNWYWGVNNSGFNDLTLGASFPFAVGPVSLTPSLNYVMLMDSDIKASNTYHPDNEYFFAGIGASIEF